MAKQRDNKKKFRLGKRNSKNDRVEEARFKIDNTLSELRRDFNDNYEDYNNRPGIQWPMRFGKLSPDKITPLMEKADKTELEQDDLPYEEARVKKIGDTEYKDWRGYLPKIDEGGENWPQTEGGFLPVDKIGTKSDYFKGTGDYKFKDWRGHIIEIPNGVSRTIKASPELPGSSTNPYYSIRDHYFIFNDNSTDYFKFDQQTIYNGGTTPYEITDPVIFGFDIIIDNLSSPLLNGSINDFIANYSNISEIAARAKVYEEFKQQFIKFFKTKTPISIDLDDPITITKNIDTSFTTKNSNILQNKRAYLNYYLKSITGLNTLIEKNSPGDKSSSITKYETDSITLTFDEDISLNIGTLTHLYKLLSWSKPNAKSIIPENLLRFNCDIIVSEIRNYSRVIRAVDTGDIKVVKDNVSRYVYSLYECQFFFNDGMPHTDSIDMGKKVDPYSGYSIKFYHKYATHRLERFMPKGDGFGQYVSYDSGAVWKLTGEGGSREPVPKFFEYGTNKFNQAGVTNPFVINSPKVSIDPINPQNGLPINRPSSEVLNDIEDYQRNRTTNSGSIPNLTGETSFSSVGLSNLRNNYFNSDRTPFDTYLNNEDLSEIEFLKKASKKNSAKIKKRRQESEVIQANKELTDSSRKRSKLFSEFYDKINKVPGSDTPVVPPNSLRDDLFNFTNNSVFR